MGLRTRIAKFFLSAIDNRGAWYPWVREPTAGSWQNGEEWRVDSVLAFHAVYSCIRVISGHIAKLKFGLQRKNSRGIWEPYTDLDISPILRKPNHYQNEIQYKQWWVASLLIRGNKYGLKQRDSRGNIVALYIIDPTYVQPMIAENGDVYYQLSSDKLSGIPTGKVAVPASEIIHDRVNCLFHPLVGVSPLFSSGSAADLGLKIQNDSSRFFSNGSRPGGLLTAPGSISDPTAQRLKAHWEANYSGVNAGRVAVLGDGLKFESLSHNAHDSQLIEQLGWTVNAVCSSFGVPLFMIGLGQSPTYNNIEALTQQFYSQTLQVLIESMEMLLDDGFSLPVDKIRVNIDLDGLFRMDSVTRMKVLTEGVRGSIYAPNEARLRENLPPLEGGDSVYLQEQNYSLEALARRDQSEDPFQESSSSPVPGLTPDQEQAFTDFLISELKNAA